MLGRDIGVVFQNPMSSLNPVLTIGEQIGEVGMAHLGHDRASAQSHARELMQRVGIPAPERRLHAFPHELSGGQRQRVAIAMAIAASPKLLIADEPTTALDTVVQAQIMALIDSLVRDTGMALLLVTHDIALAASVALQGVVMRHGEVVEASPMRDIVTRPVHPYTRTLLAASLDIDRPVPARSAPVVAPDLVLRVRSLAKSFGRGRIIERRGREVGEAFFKTQGPRALAIARADIILVMDDRNLRDLQQLCALEHHAKLRRLSDFCHQLRCNTIPDPYRGSDSDFVHVLDLLEDACDGLAQHVLALKNGNRRSCAA